MSVLAPHSMSPRSFLVKMSPLKSVSGRLRPFFDMMKPSFKTSTLIAVFEIISLIMVFTLPSNIDNGSPTLHFSARLYCTGIVKLPSCSYSGAASSTKISPLCTSRRSSFSMPSRILGPCKSCRIATLRPFFSAAFLIQPIWVSRSSFEPCEQFNRQPFTPDIIISSIISGELVAGPTVARILVLLNSLLM